MIRYSIYRTKIRYTTFTGFASRWNCYAFPMCLFRYFETGSCLFSRLRAVILFRITRLLLYSSAYTAHLRYFNAFPRPLVRVTAYHAFQRLSKPFSHLYQRKPSVCPPLRLNIPHSHRNFHASAFSTNGSIDIGLLFPVVYTFLDNDCHEPHFSPV